MGWLSWLNKRDQPAIETKSVSTPEMIMFMTRAAGVFQKWDSEVAIEQGLKASAIFYACCRLRAEAIAQVPWVAKRKVSSKWEPDPDSELQTLIDNPNPDFAWSEMLELMSYHLDLAGNSYWTIIRAGNRNRPVELWPQSPRHVKIYPGVERLIDAYSWTSGAMAGRKIEASEVIQVKTANPNSFHYGLPTIQAAGRAVDIDRDAGDWQKNSIGNRGVSDYAIVIDPDTSAEALAQIKKLHKEQQAGKDNARQPFVTTRDIKPLNQTSVEMDFVRSRMQVWQEICSAMATPLPMVGILENATLANMEVSRRVFWMDGIIPGLRRIRSQLQQQLAVDFPGYRIDYDISGIEALRDDYNKKIEAAKKLFEMGVPLVNINATLGLDISDIESIAGADIGYLQSTLLPAGFSGLDEADKSLLKALAYGSD